MPVEAVFLVGIGDGGIAHQRLEYVHIHGHAARALGDQLREQRFELFDISRHQIGGLGFWAGGIDFFNGHGETLLKLGILWHQASCRSPIWRSKDWRIRPMT